MGKAHRSKKELLERQIYGRPDKGRPTRFDAETLDKLAHAYAIGANDREAACYAGVSMSGLYRYLKDNPDYKEYRDTLKRTPVLKALANSDRLLDEGDPIHTRFILERLKKDEYSAKADLEVSGRVDVLSIEDRQTALHDYLMSFKRPETLSD